MYARGLPYVLHCAKMREGTGSKRPDVRSEVELPPHPAIAYELTL